MMLGEPIQSGGCGLVGGEVDDQPLLIGAGHLQALVRRRDSPASGCAHRSTPVREGKAATPSNRSRKQVAAARREGVTTVPGFVFGDGDGDVIVGVTPSAEREENLMRCRRDVH
ncbi:hypothetical protein [Nonomuraea sp. PA05]|uniref:hypothetical protein n=1 Tax=Nonomuraea sp. PA05 TaxID=2604466 RepID=UPI0016520088|nr:hypothetical protein [Nonomuraea sp. PA05]